MLGPERWEDLTMHLNSCGFGASVFALILGVGLSLPGRAYAADCDQGDTDAKLACLSDKVTTLETKLTQMSAELDKKANKREDDMPGQAPVDDIVRYDSVISIRNQDMRIFPRCLDNPGPDSPDISAVMATSCAPAAGQAWIIMRALD
jgi:hypothetical protein